MKAYTVKKWAAILVMPVISTSIFAFVLLNFGFMPAILVYMGALILIAAISNLLFLKNPYSQLLEGKGLLAATMDSSGIIRTFNVGLDKPWIRGRLGKHRIEDVFDRKTVLKLVPPKKADHVVHMRMDASEDRPGGILLFIPDSEQDKGMFSFDGTPMVLYNPNVKSLLTKDFMSDWEAQNFAEHTALDIKEILRDLNSNTRDFGRYIAEQMKPKAGGFFSNPIVVTIIIAIAIAILAIMFGPQIMATISGPAESAGAAIGSAAGGSSGGPILPS